MEDFDTIRVLQVFGCLNRGGAETMVMNLYHSIDRSKVQFDFVVHTDKKGDYDNDIEKMGGKIYHAPRYCVVNHLQYVIWWNNFYKKHGEYKIIHAHIRSSATIFLCIAKRMGCMTISHSHSVSNGRGIAAIIKNIMQFPIRYQVDYMFACSEEAGKWLYGKNISRRKNYKVIPNAIDSVKFDFDLVKRNQVRKALNINDKFVIGHVGRMNAVKNHEFLVKVFAELVKKRRDAVLLLIGDGDIRKNIEKSCEELGVYEKVIFLGSKSNTQDYYQAMDVFVFPSLWEGLGIAAIEAQTAGLPCIVSSCMPKEIDLGVNLVYRMNFDKGAKAWANKIIDVYVGDRHGQAEATKKIGYDVRNTAIRIQKFYLKMNKKIRDKNN